MTDDPNQPTPAQKAAAKAVLEDPDYLPEPDDPRNEATRDEAIEGDD